MTNRIYSWRGAEPAYLLNFKEVYPQAVTLIHGAELSLFT